MIWINYKKWFSMILVKLSTLLIEKGSHKQHTMPTALIGEWALWSFKVFNWFELSWCTLVHLCKYITKYLQPMHLAIWRKAKCTAEHMIFFFYQGNMYHPPKCMSRHKAIVSGFDNWCTPRTYVHPTSLAYAQFWTGVRWHVSQFSPYDLLKFSKFFWSSNFILLKKLALYIWPYILIY